MLYALRSSQVAALVVDANFVTWMDGRDVSPQRLKPFAHMCKELNPCAWMGGERSGLPRGAALTVVGFEHVTCA